MNAIPCTPRHEKQDDTFASWENLPAGVMASLSQRTVRLDWCSSWWWCYCRWCTQMGQRASEAGSEEKDDWQGQDAERQLSGWHWQTAGEEIAKKFCGRNYALNFTALQGCNMSTWRWTWGRNLSVNEGWQDSPPESFSSDLSSTKNLAPWSMQNLPAWFRKEAMGPPRPAYNFSAWNRSVEEGNGVQEYYLRSKTCHKGTPKECLPPTLVHFCSLCIFTSLSEPLSV